MYPLRGLSLTPRSSGPSMWGQRHKLSQSVQRVGTSSGPPVAPRRVRSSQCPALLQPQELRPAPAPSHLPGVGRQPAWGQGPLLSRAESRVWCSEGHCERDTPGRARRVPRSRRCLWEAGQAQEGGFLCSGPRDPGMAVLGLKPARAPTRDPSVPFTPSPRRDGRLPHVTGGKLRPIETQAQGQLEQPPQTPLSRGQHRAAVGLAGCFQVPASCLQRAGLCHQSTAHCCPPAQETVL